MTFIRGCLLFLAFLTLSGSGSSGEVSRNLAVGQQGGAKRVAVVIGNSRYPSGALNNPRNDANAIAAALNKLGFDVDLKLDATRADMEAIFKRFNRKAEQADVAAMFYAGHGIQVNGSNYIVPIDAKPQNERDLKREMIKMDDVIDDMGAAKVKLVFFDACRDNPLSRSFSRGGSRGMAAPVEATGTLISFATKHGNTAADGDSRHSPYTAALLGALENPQGVEIEQMLRRVQQRVRAATKGQQEPWRYGSLDGDFYFLPGESRIQREAVDRAVQDALQRVGDQAAVELALWESVKNSNNLEDLKEYLASYPRGTFAGLARVRIRSLESGSGSAVVRPLTQSNAAATAPVPQVPMQIAMIQPSGQQAAATSKFAFPQAGDTWTYRYVDRWRKDESREVVVKVSESSGGRVADSMSLSGGEGSDDRIYEGGPNYVERLPGSNLRIVELLPYAHALLRTELIPGMELQLPDIATGGGNYHLKAKVAGRERISVPSGTFDAVKLEITGQRSGSAVMFAAQALVPNSFVHTLWYAAEVRRAVKIEHRSGNNWSSRLDDAVLELVSFSVSG